MKCNYSRMDPPHKPRVHGPRTTVAKQAAERAQRELEQEIRRPLIPETQRVHTERGRP